MAVASGLGRGRALPAELLLSLREAFGAERDERLPSLVAALACPTGPLDDARRAAHSLGSSAVVVGEPGLAALARDLEARLDAGRPWQDQAMRLVEVLRAWSARTA